MTPRRINAFLRLADKRRKRDRAQQLALFSLAARGSEKDVNDAMAKLRAED